jgi:selenide,water dikinase
LHEILANVPKIGLDANLMVGIDTADDAAVYRLNDQQALIVTNDFFMPIVDDPYDYGRIASTNAISDVYAMGGRPILATSIVGFPVNKLPLNAMQEIMRGGVDVCRDAGIPLAGGHSIDNEEPIFGLVAVGVVHPDNIKTNAGARPGDVLLMTKPLGIGIMTTALKIQELSELGYRRVVRTMATLNKPGAWLGERGDVHAITDITGFGLAGHALEMARGAGLSISIDVDKVPVMEEAWNLASEGIVPGGAYRNMSAYGSAIDFSSGLDNDHQLVFTDPQTSGGLLVSVAPEAVDEIVAQLHAQGFTDVAAIGRVEAANGGARVAFHD